VRREARFDAESEKAGAPLQLHGAGRADLVRSVGAEKSVQAEALDFVSAIIEARPRLLNETGAPSCGSNSAVVPLQERPERYRVKAALPVVEHAGGAARITTRVANAIEVERTTPTVNARAALRAISGMTWRHDKKRRGGSYH
jgi:hypothetical protein